MLICGLVIVALHQCWRGTAAERAKIIAAEGEARAAAALGDASDTMMKHPLALQLRNLHTLAELGVEKNTTIVFPAPMMSAIEELTGFLSRESTASQTGWRNGLPDEPRAHPMGSN